MTMRRAALAFFLLLPLVSAQAPLELTDPAGDVVVEGAPAGPPDDAQHVDILRASFGEDPVRDALLFELAVAGRPGESTVQGVRGHEYRIDFRLDEAQLRVSIGVPAGATPATPLEWVLQNTTGIDDRFPAELGRGEAVMSADGLTYSAAVPRTLFGKVATVQPGAELRDIRISATQVYSQNCCLQGEPITYVVAIDRAPDTGGATHTISYGAEFAANLLVWSPKMLRASNGGATTIVYPLEVTGQGDIELSADETPDGWSALLPIPSIPNLDGRLTVPLVLTADFEHQHGKTETFRVEATDGIDNASTLLGIKYLEYPQPTGHHSSLYWHAVPVYDDTTGLVVDETGVSDARRFIISTLQQDHRDQGGFVNGEGGFFPGTSSPGNWSWTMPLDPGLELGIDPDTNGTGTLNAVIQGFPSGPATLAGRIFVEAGEERFPMFVVEPEEFPLGSSAQDVEATISVDPRAAPFVYKTGANLVAELYVEGHFAGAGTGPDSRVELQSGGSMRLPLLEYHDPIAFALGDVDFSLSPIEMTVPPNSRIKASMDVFNEGPSRTIRLFAQATPEDAISVAETTKRIEAGEGRIEFIVDSHDLTGEDIVGVLVAIDGDQIAYGQVIATIDPTLSPQDGVDGQRSPGMAVGVLACALLLIAGRRWRPCGTTVQGMHRASK